MNWRRDSKPAAIALSRRLEQRRQTLAAQVGSYALGAGVLLVYAHAGTISMAVPSVFFLCGASLIGIFAALSETHVSDRFEDHLLTVSQVGSHVVVQLGFLLWAPQIGYAFLNVLFLIFGVASFRMTPRQAAISWTFTTAGVAPIFLLTRMPIGMPIATTIERFARRTLLRPYGRAMRLRRAVRQSLRKKLYKRSAELAEANKRIELPSNLTPVHSSFVGANDLAATFMLRIRR